MIIVVLADFTPEMNLEDQSLMGKKKKTIPTGEQLSLILQLEPKAQSII